MEFTVTVYHTDCQPSNNFEKYPAEKNTDIDIPAQTYYNKD